MVWLERPGRANDESGQESASHNHAWPKNSSMLSASHNHAWPKNSSMLSASHNHAWPKNSSMLSASQNHAWPKNSSMLVHLTKNLLLLQKRIQKMWLGGAKSDFPKV